MFMAAEDQKITFINITTEHLYDKVDDLYEALMDDELDEVQNITRGLFEVIKDLNQTFSNKI